MNVNIKAQIRSSHCKCKSDAGEAPGFQRDESLGETRAHCCFSQSPKVSTRGSLWFCRSASVRSGELPRMSVSMA